MTINIKKFNRQLSNIIKSKEFSTKISIFMSSRSTQDGFDSYEAKYNYNNLNPLTIKGYVNEIDPAKLIYRQYGLSEQGAVEILVEERYENYIRNCNKIEINNKEYHVFKEGVGNRCLITQVPFKLIQVILRKNE